MNEKINNLISKIKVIYDNRIVGYLKQSSDNEILFQYDDEWLINGFSISPFSLPLTKKIYKSNDKNLNYLFGVFNDSLPDGWGLFLLKLKLSRLNINIKEIRPLTFLSLLSSNGLGGLSYYPCQNKETNVHDIDFDKLQIEFNNILNERQTKNFDDVYLLGGSSGGARPKIHKDIDGKHWIIKFPSALDPKEIGIEEYNANKLAKKCGINVAIYKLFPSKKCKGYFGVQRFDWIENKKLHVVSLSGLLETSHHEFNLSYEILFQVIENICVNKRIDIVEAYKRMCFNVFYGNKDDHGKNWLFIYDEELNGYKLSPFFDITNTKYLNGHALSINGKDNPNENDLLKIGERYHISKIECKKIIAKIKQVLKIK